MRLLLLAPPGAGKGTQGTRIAEHYGIVHLAAGDLLRDEVARATELGRTAAAYMETGELVPDELVIRMMLDHVVAADGRWILDGFPRTLRQAEAAYEWAVERDLTLHAAIYLDVPEDELVRRLLERAAVQGRADDDDSTIRNRLAVFHRETAPLIDYYRSREILVAVDALGDVDGITERIVAALEPFIPAAQ
jgi:adenylate kinase